MINLINGDCLTVMNNMKDFSVDYSFTSPPYNRKRNDKYDNYNDNVSNWFDWQVKVIDELIRISSKGVFYNIQANYYNKSDVYKLIGKYSDQIKEIIIWEKTNPMPASGNSITNSVEYFIYLSSTPLKSNSTYTKNIISTSVNSSMPKNHKAVMKQDVCDWFITKFTKENDIILDCFMGMGTTGISCVKNNRSFVGIEIDKEYFEYSKNAIDNMESYEH